MHWKGVWQRKRLNCDLLEKSQVISVQLDQVKEDQGRVLSSVWR